MESQAVIILNSILNQARRVLNQLFNRFVSVPIFIKILGVGMFVVVLFGAIVLYRTRISVARTFYGMLENETKTLALMVAANLERPLAVRDYLSTQLVLNDAKQIYPDILYGIVEDKANRIFAHTFEGTVPPDLVGLLPPVTGLNSSNKPHLEIFNNAAGFIMEASVPIIKGEPVRLRIGTSDRQIRQQLYDLTRLLLVSTIFCALLGCGLALILTYLITRPVKNLLAVTNRISQGDFTSRSQVFWNDEIGKFAVAFNHMADNLQQYRREVEEKEAVRQALLEKVIFIQEEERRRIAQDLHDQLGQSLSVMLLDIRQPDSGTQGFCEKHFMIEKRLSELIDEVRQLAWGMHPAILDDYGLDEALARYISTISKATRMDIAYQYLCPRQLPRLPIRIEVALYRIAQEAITNIVRHADTKQASVVFMRNERETILLVEDGGKGFDTAAHSDREFTHMGLVGMSERTSMLSGEFTVESVPGMGTTIRVKIPQEILS